MKRITTAAIFALSAAVCSPTSATRLDQPTGVVEGLVTFVGAECGPGATRTTPPCTGEYPHYDIVVFDSSGERTVARTQSDQGGRYAVSLDAGEYVVFVPAGTSERRRVSVRVLAGRRVTLDLRVDTGIR